MRIVILSLLTSFTFSLGIHSQEQKAKIDFEVLEYDFGQIKEKDGVVDYNFAYANSGNLPLILSHVSASCGCTTPKWSQKPVIPGQKGSINVGYNPSNRPGKFEKTITVKSNAKNSVVYLKIKGYVLSEKKNLQSYNFSIGDLKLSSLHAAYGALYKGKSKTKIIELSNASTSEELKVRFKSLPQYLNVKLIPEVLPPGKTGRMEITFNTAVADDWDYVTNRLSLLVNEKLHRNNVITVTAIVREDFSKMSSEDLAKAPVVSFDSEKFHFGEIIQGEEVEHKFKLINTGKSNLVIRKLRASCGCTVVQPEKDVIKPGKSTMIKARFNSKGKSGNQKYAVTVITNDPKNYRKILWIEGKVNLAQAKNK